jgi:hypothetical protein
VDLLLDEEVELGRPLLPWRIEGDKFLVVVYWNPSFGCFETERKSGLSALVTGKELIPFRMCMRISCPTLIY